MSFKLTYLEDFLCAFLIGMSCVLLFNLWGLSFDTWYLREDSWIMNKGNLSIIDIFYLLIRRQDDFGVARPLKDFFFGIPLLIKADPIYIYRTVNSLLFLSNGLLLALFSYKFFSSRLWSIAIGSSFLMLSCHVQPVYWLCAMHTTTGIFFSLLVLLLAFNPLKKYTALLMGICFWFSILSRETQVIIFIFWMLIAWYQHKKVAWGAPILALIFSAYYIFPLYESGRIESFNFTLNATFWNAISYFTQFFYARAGVFHLTELNQLSLVNKIGLIYLLITFLFSVFIYFKRRKLLYLFYFIGTSIATLTIAPFSKNMAMEYSAFLGIFIVLSPLLYLDFYKENFALNFKKTQNYVNSVLPIILPIFFFFGSFSNIEHYGTYMHRESKTVKNVITAAVRQELNTPLGVSIIIEDLSLRMRKSGHHFLTSVFLSPGLSLFAGSNSIFIDKESLPEALALPKLDPDDSVNEEILDRSKAIHWIYSTDRFWPIKN
ncbi:MAG: hypothetical protein M9962_12375 [Oligoflexia bacterium]|nr:hypothetical protein [Oligoflexia bacterium]